MPYTINQLAKLSGVTVRTLHYYDEIGLLKPSSIHRNGYRSYEKKELLRLQQILFFRELDFPLADIKKILDKPDFEIVGALRRHKDLMKLKQKRFDKLINTIDKTIKHMAKQQNMKDEELYDAFNDPDVKRYQEEAKQRWGNTDAYKQSMKKVGKLTKAQMEKIKKDGIELTKKLAACMDKEITDKEVQKLIGQHYKNIQFFYDCPLEMYRNLGKMYMDDPRFTAYYDKHGKGLASFMRDAIAHFCDNKEK